MAHFAKVVNGIVEQVIMAEQEFIDSINDDSCQWIQTSYNTIGGAHSDGRPMRKNFAGVGFTYDSERDAFIPPQPYPSWVLDEESCTYSAPVPRPAGKGYSWNESSNSWNLAKE
jgi:hypothetical protein